MNIFKFFKSKTKDFDSIARKELEENRDAVESLKKYDKGEKEISTARVQKHLSNI